MGRRRQSSPLYRHVSRVVVTAVLLLTTEATAEQVKPHVIGRVQYEGELGTESVEVDKVEVYRSLPTGVSVLGLAHVIIADQTEPSLETAETPLKRIAAQVGGDAVGLVKTEDVTREYRSPAPGAPRGITALQEYEMAALVARAHTSGGEILIGNKRFAVRRADRFGDSDVTGPVTFTLSRTHDEREWRVGKAGPRYRALKRDRWVTVVTGPSGTDYDVKIVRRRAKVFHHNRREMYGEADGSANTPTEPQKKQLLYKRFTLKIGSFSKSR